ncbi:hypothetical protein CL622_03075 [archaeon]|nr:hypothetical protein [archaeon]|tara:strand:+ start:545 stop:931 length:387 start_codon:yes stop_codon:yes gene_type:complete
MPVQYLSRAPGMGRPSYHLRAILELDEWRHQYIPKVQGRETQVVDKKRDLKPFPVISELHLETNLENKTTPIIDLEEKHDKYLEVAYRIAKANGIPILELAITFNSLHEPRVSALFFQRKTSLIGRLF